MIVDDNEDDVMLLHDIFDPLPDVELVAHAADGEQAIRHLFECRDGNAAWPDLVLLDLNMPKLDGYGVLYAMRRDIELSKLPIVVLSTSDADRDVERSYKAGACSYVVKPSDFDTYDARLRDLVAYWTGVCEIPGRIVGN